MSMKIKKPSIKKILKGFGRFILNTFTVITITIGTMGLLLSYINITPYIAEYYPALQLGYYTLETLFIDIQYWQSLSYIAWSISGGMIALGLAIHIRSVGRLWRGIKATPRAIVNTPVNTYRKIKAIRDWILAKVTYLNEESAKWRRVFNVLKSPYSLLRAMGFSPQMAMGLLFAGSTVGGGVVVNETLLAERNFTAGDAGIYAAPNNVPDNTLEETMKWREENKEDNTLRIVLAATPVSEIRIENVTIGTAFTGSALPSGKTEAVLIEGTDVSGGTSTRLQIGELIFEKSRCKSLTFADINAHTINIIGNASDGQSINQTAGTARMRAIGGGHHQAEAMITSGGTYDRIWIDAPTSAVNGRIDKLVLSNLYTRGGTCVLQQMDIGTLTIQLNEVGEGNGFATKEFVIATTVTSANWNVTDNVEVAIVEAPVQ